MKTFKNVLLLCILGTYLVILAGSVVRGTGSGLGCPDWPRCFGQWVPPTDISELPADYKEIYKISGKVIADFDPFKTWTEYINRLLGATLGVFILILFGQSFKMKDYDRSIPWFCGLMVILISVQGYIGAKVVSTHLAPYMITIHMFLALVLLFCLLYLRKYCQDLEDVSLVPFIDEKAQGLTKILVGFTFFQVLLGTQVRQQVDHFTRDTNIATSATVIDHLGAVFYIHRSFSLLILGIFVYLIFYFEKTRFNRKAFFLTLFALFFVLGNVVSGIALNYFGFPANAQPIHLFFGVLALGTLYTLHLNLKGTLLE